MSIPPTLIVTPNSMAGVVVLSSIRLFVCRRHSLTEIRSRTEGKRFLLGYSMEDWEMA